jgi:uncharacterized cupin superfamily protein
MCLASIVMTDASVSDISGIVDFAVATAELTQSKPAPDRLLAGAPEQKTRNFFSDPTGQFFAGTWESTPGKWRVRYAESEFCHILRGQVHIEDERGNGRTFQTGDSFVVPAGFIGTWHVKVPTLKLYAIFEAASK